MPILYKNEMKKTVLFFIKNDSADMPIKWLI